MTKATVSALLVVALGAGCYRDEDPVSLTSCADLSGTYVATTFVATATADPSLSQNLLAGGGAYSLRFDSGKFTSVYVATPGGPATVRTSTFTITGGAITLGGHALVPDGPPGDQVFTCVTSGNTLTLDMANTSHMFPGTASVQSVSLKLTLVRQPSS